MKYSICLLVLLVLITNVLGKGDKEQENGKDNQKGKGDKEWNEFTEKYGKKYKSKLEEMTRRSIFEKNLKRINFHNRRPDVLYKQKLNQFADLDEIEKNYFKGALLEGNITNDAAKYGQKSLLRSLPTNFDLRSSPCMPQIHNQGSCGSCWAFSATSMLDYYNCKKTGSFTDLGEQHMVDCNHYDKGCNGGFYTRAWRWVTENSGQCSETTYPYNSGSTSVTGSCKNCSVSGTCSGYKWVFADSTSIMNILTTIGPVSAALHANDNFMAYDTGIYSESGCSTKVNHAVNIVGYGESNGIPYWIVRNSWGSWWGDNGYILIKRGDNVCRIEDYIAYPTV
ncbi:uncharacterized protein LOC136028742 [Artemia franciscana]|uniref:Uncharacterized protein n=1 Tax=Artemia franciscana TaxID=6661 RepID=A0AA88KUW4_ARTSF|nr:hypothetical protein QYM36_015574 [Artemia franciscana]